MPLFAICQCIHSRLFSYLKQCRPRSLRSPSWLEVPEKTACCEHRHSACAFLQFKVCHLRDDKQLCLPLRRQKRVNRKLPGAAQKLKMDATVSSRAAQCREGRKTHRVLGRAEGPTLKNTEEKEFHIHYSSHFLPGLMPGNGDGSCLNIGTVSWAQAVYRKSAVCRSNITILYLGWIASPVQKDSGIWSNSRLAANIWSGGILERVFLWPLDYRCCQVLKKRWLS